MLLWAAGPWREELRQLLELLAAHADHRLHPLPGPCRCACTATTAAPKGSLWQVRGYRCSRGSRADSRTTLN